MASVGTGASRPTKRARTEKVSYHDAHEEVTEPVKIAIVRKQVKELCGRPNHRNDQLPGPLATTMSNRSLKKVIAAGAVGTAETKSSDAAIKAGYWVCEKSDGDRMMMLCLPT